MKPSLYLQRSSLVFHYNRIRGLQVLLRCLAIFQPSFFQIFFWCPCPSLIPIICMLDHLVLSHSSLILFFFFFRLFSLCFILDSFYCYVFKYLTFSSTVVESAVNPMHVLFISRLGSFFISSISSPCYTHIFLHFLNK